MAKAQTKHDLVGSAADTVTKTPPPSVTSNIDDIARRAYDLYLSRGCKPGHDVDDWMQAEQELRDLLGSDEHAVSLGKDGRLQS